MYLQKKHNIQCNYLYYEQTIKEVIGLSSAEDVLRVVIVSFISAPNNTFQADETWNGHWSCVFNFNMLKICVSDVTQKHTHLRSERYIYNHTWSITKISEILYSAMNSNPVKNEKQTVRRWRMIGVDLSDMKASSTMIQLLSSVCEQVCC